MRAVVQRVREASVEVAGREISWIGPGMLVLLGVATTDSETDAERLSAKVAGLRMFEDAEGKMNLDLAAAGGAVLCVSQFTLYADVRRGNRPSFDGAAPRAIAEPLYEQFCAAIEARGIACGRGVFGAEMRVRLVNDGPVTLLIDTAALDRPRHA
jgi:D-tyrosyl-tRNA(Tyr) deacylase